jgi:hypothetical protein
VKISAKNHRPRLSIDFKRFHLAAFNAWMQPRTVAAKQEFCRTARATACSGRRAADPGRVRIDIGVAHEVVDQRDLRLQSSAKLPKCGMMKLTSGYSVANNSPPRPLPSRRREWEDQPSGLADFTRDARIVTMHLDPQKAIRRTASSTMRKTRPGHEPIHERESKKAVGARRQ